MKTLYLVRHAKAEEKSSTDDFGRKLVEKGRNDAGKLGRFLLREKVKADLIVTSPALRALQTAEIVAEPLGKAGTIRKNKKIYDASLRDLIDVLRGLDGKLNKVMLVGHNPGFGELLDYLCEECEEQFPKSAVAALQLKVPSWKDVSRNSAKLDFFYSPKHDKKRTKG